MFPALPEWTAAWARRNQCGARPSESRPAPDVTLVEYKDCKGHASVLLYTLEGGGHTWPGGKPMPDFWVGATNHDIDATSLMWSFFREHPLVTLP